MQPKNPAAVALGTLGGRARFRAMTKKRRANVSRYGAMCRELLAGRPVMLASCKALKRQAPDLWAKILRKFPQVDDVAA